jgi:hypothetical protein
MGLTTLSCGNVGRLTTLDLIIGITVYAIHPPSPMDIARAQCQDKRRTSSIIVLKTERGIQTSTGLYKYVSYISDTW